MTTRRRGRAWRAAGAVAVTLAAMAAAAGCGSQSDAEPTVESVNFAPRLVITADSGALRAEAGARSGAERTGDGTTDWSVPDGSVVELTVQGSDAARITGQRIPPDGGRAIPLVDTGELQPGERVVVALTEPGDVEFGVAGTSGSTLTVAVVPAG